ncbi:hypothetical protein CHUAL_010013 [Chamberlinius hualienensis]
MSTFEIRVVMMVSVVTVMLNCFSSVSGLHTKGTWSTNENFFKFLVKFGFQRTNQHDRSNTQGYIFGNITSSSNLTHSVTFVVVDKGYFTEYYGNRTLYKEDMDKTCQQMFQKIDTIAYDAQCHRNNIEDFLRKIPCPENGLCVDEDQPQRVVSGFQFTYGVQDINQPRFWYVSMVACRRTEPLTNCTWVHDPDLDIVIDYDIWLVNGNPYKKDQNQFEYQFSFEKQNVIEIYIVFLMLNLGLIILQVYAGTQQKHPIILLLSGTILLALFGNIFHLIHYLKFSNDGEGIEGVGVVGDICDILSECMFVLILLLLAKGWAITLRKLTGKFIIGFVMALYIGSSILLYAWKTWEMDVIEDVHEYKTWPGWLSLILRLLIMAWFLFELRRTMQKERSKTKLQFLLHFGASSLVWFIYLPIMAVVSINVLALWRFKLFIGISSSVNFLAFASMVHLLWPVRHDSYVQLNNVTAVSTDELEEFNEAPHVINQKSSFNRHPVS